MTNLAPVVATTVAEATRQIVDSLKRGTKFTIPQILQELEKREFERQLRPDEAARRAVVRMAADGIVQPAGKRGHMTLYVRL